MDFVAAVKKVFADYAKFEGRSRRSEFWYYYLLVSLVLSLIYVVVRISEKIGFILSAMAFVIFFIPTIAVSCRRLHDIGKSGWCQLVSYIPCIGFILMLIWCFKDGESDENIYGMNPKGSEAVGVAAQYKNMTLSQIFKSAKETLKPRAWLLPAVIILGVLLCAIPMFASAGDKNAPYRDKNDYDNDGDIDEDDFRKGVDDYLDSYFAAHPEKDPGYDY